MKWAGPARAGLLSATMFALTACGIMAPRSNEGFADLDSPGLFDTDRTMAISVGPTLIRIAIWALEEDDDETAELLRGIDGVRIRIYEIDGDAQRVADKFQKMSAKLAADNWDPVMLVKEDSEQTHMFVRSDGEEIQGITLLTSDGEEEAVVINLMGHLEPHHFGDAMAALDVDSPDVEVAH